MNRASLSPAERDFRSRLAQLAHDNWLVRGTLLVWWAQVGQAPLPLRERRIARLPVSGPKPRWKPATTLHPQVGGPPRPAGGERLPATATPHRRSLRTRMEAHAGEENAGTLRAYCTASFAMPRRCLTFPARCSTKSPTRVSSRGRLPR